MRNFYNPVFTFSRGNVTARFPGSFQGSVSRSVSGSASRSGIVNVNENGLSGPAEVVKTGNVPTAKVATSNAAPVTIIANPQNPSEPLRYADPADPGKGLVFANSPAVFYRPPEVDAATQAVQSAIAAAINAATSRANTLSASGVTAAQFQAEAESIFSGAEANITAAANAAIQRAVNAGAARHDIQMLLSNFSSYRASALDRLQRLFQDAWDKMNAPAPTPAPKPSTAPASKPVAGSTRLPSGTYIPQKRTENVQIVSSSAVQQNESVPSAVPAQPSPVIQAISSGGGGGLIPVLPGVEAESVPDAEPQKSNWILPLLGIAGAFLMSRG